MVCDWGSPQSKQFHTNTFYTKRKRWGRLNLPHLLRFTFYVLEGIRNCNGDTAWKISPIHNEKLRVLPFLFGGRC
jgi:hypothetical protein